MKTSVSFLQQMQSWTLLLLFFTCCQISYGQSLFQSDNNPGSLNPEAEQPLFRPGPGGSPAHLLTAEKDPDQWHFMVAPYIMFANAWGTEGIGNLPNIKVDQNPSDLFNHLNFGAMVYAQASGGPWTISSDIIYFNLKASVSGTPVIYSGDASTKQLAWELALMHKLTPWLDAGLAGQLNNLNGNYNLAINSTAGTFITGGTRSKAWVDPSIIGNAHFVFSPKWSLVARGNIGGFDIGSKLFWQLQAYVGYTVSPLFTLSFGYRIMDINYQSGTGADRFLYDVNTFGPVLRFGFNF
jgi:hypothetical protein